MILKILFIDAVFFTNTMEEACFVALLKLGCIRCHCGWKSIIRVRYWRVGDVWLLTAGECLHDTGYTINRV